MSEEKEGYQGFVVPAPPIVIPPPGGLLGSVYDFRNTSAQSFAPFAGAAILFAAAGTQNLPAPGGAELTLPLPTDDDFVLLTAGVWLAQWNATIEILNAVAATGLNTFDLDLWSAPFTPVPGTNRLGNIFTGSIFANMSGQVVLSDPGGGANTFQLAITHTGGPDTIRVVTNRVRIQWMRVSSSQ